ncbi:MAG: hypothetical protein M4579_006541 [Chaenotheca gracillima]|nr:MAG: hypothetical protein M4579_006541 [Chaenotheca gracillima]
MGGSVPEIPGVELEEPVARSLRWEVAQLLGRDSQSFPGAQPISFTRAHLGMLENEDFFVCEKSDGIRCLLYCTVNEVGAESHYLIDRKNAYYHIAGLHFPLAENRQAFHDATLIDGELVNDTLPDGSVQLKYLVFDCLTLDGDQLMQRTLDKRIAYFTDKFYTPYKRLYREFPGEVKYLKFLVEFKKMERSYGIEMIFKDILPKLAHGNDGLIFTCRTTPYKSGTDEHILKWKPENENTVDFRLNMEFPLLELDPEEEAEVNGANGEVEGEPYDYDAMPIFHLSVYISRKSNQTIYKPYAKMYMSEQEWEDLKALNKPLEGILVECYFDDHGRWRFFRFREDKENANHISTVESVIDSIHDRVTENDLVAAAKRIKDGWRKRNAAQEQIEAAAAAASSSAGTANGQSEQERAKKRAEVHRQRESEEFSNAPRKR